jgi:hypothetical protein
MSLLADVQKEVFICYTNELKSIGLDINDVVKYAGEARGAGNEDFMRDYQHGISVDTYNTRMTIRIWLNTQSQINTDALIAATKLKFPKAIGVSFRWGTRSNPGTCLSIAFRFKNAEAVKRVPMLSLQTEAKVKAFSKGFKFKRRYNNQYVNTNTVKFFFIDSENSATLALEKAKELFPGALGCYLVPAKDNKYSLLINFKKGE